MSILDIILAENKKRKHRILNQCPTCFSIMEVREIKNKKLRLYCTTCKCAKGMLGSKTWNRKVKKAHGETKEQQNKTIPLKILKTMEYRKYLNTGHWKRRRKAYYAKNKKICFCCKGESYVLHHINYSRRGEELDKDLIPLCEKCHNEVHNLILNENTVSLKDAHIQLECFIRMKL